MSMIHDLCHDIETAIGRPMQTPKDFEYLREHIYARLHVLLSRTTLMRLWDYIEGHVSPRRNTLNILSQFLGYQSWEDYEQNTMLPKDQQSSPVLGRRLSVKDSLCVGNKLRLTWQPGRVCDIEYLGDLRFQVTSSKNTRLHEGDTFECSLIVEGEPLYLDNLRQGNRPPVAYICGKKSGVRYDYPLIT